MAVSHYSEMVPVASWEMFVVPPTSSSLWSAVARRLAVLAPSIVDVGRPELVVACARSVLIEVLWQNC